MPSISPSNYFILIASLLLSSQEPLPIKYAIPRNEWVALGFAVVDGAFTLYTLQSYTSSISSELAKPILANETTILLLGSEVGQRSQLSGAFGLVRLDDSKFDPTLISEERPGWHSPPDGGYMTD